MDKYIIIIIYKYPYSVFQTLRAISLAHNTSYYKI